MEATGGIYQRIVRAYRRGDRAAKKHELGSVIGVLAGVVPAALSEFITLGRTLKRRAEDVLAYFEWPSTSNGPTKAINGQLEHLRDTALEFRNLARYITRALLDTRGADPLSTIYCDEPDRLVLAAETSPSSRTGGKPLKVLAYGQEGSDDDSAMGAGRVARRRD